MPHENAGPSRRRTLRRLLVATLALLLLASLQVPAGASEAPPIEGIPSYDPQDSCSPKAKRGTLALAAHLMKRYPGSGSSGISRSCTASGTSEHKEGRAFDWRLSATSKRERGYAKHFLGRLFATDKRGHVDALARRMGIMYLIWNDHIWSASARYKKRDYLHPACSKVKTCSVTLRHRDHMHISLTRKAARGKTSWYQSGAKPKPGPKPAPKPDPKPQPRPEKQPAKRTDGVLDLARHPYGRVVVPADGSAVETRFNLREGTTYKLTAGGLHRYGSIHQVADAACVWSRKSESWKPRPGAKKSAVLNLTVNGRSLFGGECRPGHVYSTTFTPRTTGPLVVRIAGKRPSATGRLVLAVSRHKTKVGAALPSYPSLSPAPAPVTKAPRGYGLLAETVTLPATSSGAVYTRRALERGATYKVTVSGVARLGSGVLSDGQCVAVRGTWYRQASMDLRVPNQDHGNLFLNGEPFQSRSSGCSERTHTLTYKADRLGKLRLDLWDPVTRADNSGELTVRLQRVTGLPVPTPATFERPKPRQPEWQLRHDFLKVPADSREGSISEMRLNKGERVQLIVRGSHSSNGYAADASCVRTSGGWLRKDPANQMSQDPLDLWVDGAPVSWRAIGPSDTCSVDDHAYTTFFTATKNGPIRLALLDLDFRDNKGALEVTLLRD